MLSLLAFIPILITLVLMTVFNWSAKRCLLISLVLAVILGFAFWDISAKTLFACLVYGVLSSLDILIIITGAILVMNTLKES